MRVCFKHNLNLLAQLLVHLYLHGRVFPLLLKVEKIVNKHMQKRCHITDLNCI